MIGGVLPVHASAGTAWRLVEAQHRVSTMKLVDGADEQSTLEELLDDSKPPVPVECAHLHYLLFTPFRYVPRHDSRFARRASDDRAFYAAESRSTAVAEIAFHRLLFFAESPATDLPANPLELTAFSIRYRSDRSIDLSEPPLNANRADWLATQDYSACQALASRARSEGVELLRSTSVRDPEGGMNVTLLSCRAFEQTQPLATAGYRMMLTRSSVSALAIDSGTRLFFEAADFTADARLGMR